jgi:DNA-binding CsgD family transcriptional regulator
MPAPTESLVGRDQEVGALQAFLSAPPAGDALLIEGEPGIGKTTVWLAGVSEARGAGYRVLLASPAEPEAKLSFSVLRDLFDRIEQALLDGLPPPQSRALGVALLRADLEGKPAARQTVSVGVLEVLREMARNDRVLVAIDDLQWMDLPSARVLGFAARRLGAERVSFLFSARATGSQLDPHILVRALGEDRVKRLPLGPLSVGALSRILGGEPRVVLNRPMLLKLHRASGGNPLFAREIAGALARRSAPIPAGRPLPVPETLQAAVRGHLAELRPAARSAVLVVAALSSPSRAVVEGALGTRGASAVARAVEGGALAVEDGRIALTHPLIGSVVYAEATDRQRRSLHARLAEAVDDVEERARHLALAATGPDADVAATLQDAARIARSRGAPEAAAELMDQAVELTPPSDVREQRMVQAADHHFAAGDAGRARSLLERVASTLPAGAVRGRALWRLARIRFMTESLGEAVSMFEQALQEAGDDLRLRAEIEQALAFAAIQGGNMPAGHEHARAALDLAQRVEEPALLALALARVATIEFIMGMGLDTASFDRSVELEGALDPDVPFEWRPSFNYAAMRMFADDFVGARTLFERLLRGIRERGDEGALPSILFSMSQLECWAGDWRLADRYATEALQASLQAGNEQTRVLALMARTLLDAHLGRIEQARRAAEEGLALAQAVGAMAPMASIISVLGFIELSLGDAAAAHRHLAPLSDMIAAMGVAEPGTVRFLPDEIEALIALGEIDRAAGLVDQLEARGRALDRPSALVTARRCRGLLLAATGDLAGALEACDHALRDHERLPMPFELGRTLLARGQVARRAKKWGEARASLDQALAIFERLGARLWVDRARAELERVGGRAPAPLELTPTELRVAEHVAAGLSTKEVAEVLFVSPKTVEASLTRIYRKLGVRSRGELAARMSSGPGLPR